MLHTVLCCCQACGKLCTKELPKEDSGKWEAMDLAVQVALAQKLYRLAGRARNCFSKA